MIAQRLIERITNAERVRWSAGTPADWAMESFAVAQSHVYGSLPVASAPNRYERASSAVFHKWLKPAGSFPSLENSEEYG